MSMTENEIIKYIEHHAFISDEVKDNAIQAIKEVQQYRNMGIVETLTDMYETGYAKGIDDFVSAILQKFTEEERNGNYRFYSCELKQGIADLGEQLKGGAKWIEQDLGHL